jgi:DNA-binding GntR family transcriptional regulator
MVDMVEPQRYGSATEGAYEHLKHLILTAELAPGAELREAALAEATGFGRTPVRDALRRLIHEGFVEVRPRQGYRVSFVTLARVRDLFEMRLLLEPMAVELAAQRAPQAKLEALRPLAQEVYLPGDPRSYEQFLVDNREFHARIAQAAGNEILARTLRVLLEDMQRLFFVSFGGQHSASEQMHEHHELFDALVTRDAARARAIVVAQIEESRARVMEALLRVAGPSSPAAEGVVLAGGASP